MKRNILSKNSFLTAALAVIVILLAESCGTGTNLAAVPNSWNFSITGSVNGNYYIGDTLKFQSTASDNSIFLWTFGDGNSSSQATPLFTFYHIPHDRFGNAVTDTVTLVVNNDIYHEVVKPINVLPPVPRISQTWSWNGGFIKTYGTCCPSFSSHPLPDTSFAITPIDNYTINVWGVNLPFLADSNYFSNVKTAMVSDATTIIYTRDTLFFRQSTGDTIGGAVITYFHAF